MSATAQQDNYLENGRFKIDCAKLPQSAVLCVSCDISPVLIRVADVTTGNTSQQRVFKPMDTNFGTVTLRMRVPDSGQNQDAKDWFTATKTQPKGNCRSDITVTLKKRDGADARSFQLKDVFPIQYSAGNYTPDSASQLCELTCQIGYTELS